MNIVPVRAQLYQDAYRATLAQTGDSAKAHQAGVEAVERALAFYDKKAAAEQAAKIGALVSPRTRLALYDEDPQLREHLAGQVGWAGWARRAHDAKTTEGGTAMKPAVPAALPVDDDEQLAELIDPRRRAALFARRPDLAHRLSEQVGWPKAARRGDVPAWDKAVVNEWLLAEQLHDDPRLKLLALAEQLAAEKAKDFLVALEEVKKSEPELVARVAAYVL